MGLWCMDGMGYFFSFLRGFFLWPFTDRAELEEGIELTYVAGRLVSIARGEMQYFDPDGIPTATEGCKSNALMRCCKDIGIASELWDPRFIRKFLSEKTKEVWVEHATTKKKRKLVLRKDDVVKYPFKEVKM